MDKECIKCHTVKPLSGFEGGRNEERKAPQGIGKKQEEVKWQNFILNMGV